MHLNQCVEQMKVNRWILVQISNHNRLEKLPGNQAPGFTHLPYKILLGCISLMLTKSLLYFLWERDVKTEETWWKVLKTQVWAECSGLFSSW